MSSGKPTKLQHSKVKLRNTVLLVNLGTPERPTYFATMRFLREFLSDRRVINIPRWIWYPILYGFILPFRSRSAMLKYRHIAPDGKMPLLQYSEALTKAVDAQVTKTNANTHVELAMRYGSKSIYNALHKLKDIPHQHLIVIPLFPQYSATTSASVFDEVARTLRQWNFLPRLTFIRDYCNESAYIDALAATINHHWQKNPRAEKLLITYHGLPEINHIKGDPYACYCFKTSRLLAERLALEPTQYETVFQSRFGPSRWLQPYTEDTIVKLAQSGTKSIDVIAPSFAVDCLETIDEIKREYQEIFHENGGEKLHYIPALNASTPAVNLLCDIIKRAIST